MSLEDFNNSPEKSKATGDLLMTQQLVYSTPDEQIGAWRRRCGYGLIVVSISIFLSIAVYSGRFIDQLEPRSSEPYVFDYIRLSARAIVTTTMAVFAYKILRAGERMILPFSMVKSTDDLKLVLGFNRLEPAGGLIKNSDLLKALIEIFKSRIGDNSK
jgi:hypothetical protein